MTNELLIMAYFYQITHLKAAKMPEPRNGSKGRFS